MNILFLIGGIAALATAGFFIHAGFKYTRMISGIFMSLVYRPAREESAPARGERTTILDSSDHEIEALVLKTPGARRVAVFCHESGSGKESWEKYAYFLPAMGFHLISFDLGESDAPDGSENSLTQWPTEESVQRLLTVIRWARRVFGPEMPVLLFGVSNGADIALAASIREPAVRAVVADGLFSMKEIFRDYIRRWAPVLVRPNLFGERYPAWVVEIFASLGFWYSQKRSGRKFVDVEQCLRRRRAPLLMIHGQEDDYVPQTHQRFLERFGAKAVCDHWVVPQAGHNQAVTASKGRYEMKIRDFIQGAL